MMRLLPVIQGIPDNDTTSGIFSKDKKTIFNMINKNQQDYLYIEKLFKKDLNQETISGIFENFLVKVSEGVDFR